MFYYGSLSENPAASPSLEPRRANGERRNKLHPETNKNDFTQRQPIQLINCISRDALTCRRAAKEFIERRAWRWESCEVPFRGKELRKRAPVGPSGGAKKLAKGIPGAVASRRWKPAESQFLGVHETSFCVINDRGINFEPATANTWGIKRPEAAVFVFPSRTAP